MNLELLGQLIKPLPYTIRGQVEGYAASIQESAEEIFADAGVRFDAVLLDRLVFLAGLRRLWTLIDSQFAILDNSLKILSQDGLSGFAVGGRRLDPTSKEYIELARLRADLAQTIRDLGCEQYAFAYSVRDILLRLRREIDGHR